MIYLFTGNNRYLLQQEALRWKKGFIEKHGEENITYISSLDGNSKSTIPDLLVSRSLFAEKRLVIIDGFPFSGEKAFSGASDLESQILGILGDIPDEVLVVFVSCNPDKRKTGFKQLKKIAKIKEFNVGGEDEVLTILRRKYGEAIEVSALQRLIFLKGGDLQKTISEIEKLKITHTRINREHIEAHIIPEFEESIFAFIDTLISKNRTKVFSELENLISYSNLYAIYQSILANLRVFLYIEFLKQQRKSPKEIGDILKLGNRAFLINKRHKSSFKSLSALYINLLDFDKNMKFGKFVSSDEDDMKRELERVFLKFMS